MLLPSGRSIVSRWSSHASTKPSRSPAWSARCWRRASMTSSWSTMARPTTPRSQAAAAGATRGPRAASAAMAAPAPPALRRCRQIPRSSAFSMATAATSRASLPAVVGPVAAGQADFVMGSRLRGVREPGSMTPQQIVAGWLAGILHAARPTACASPTCRRFAPCGSIGLRALGMSEQTYGWNLEMQMRAAAAGLRILEVPVDHRCRRGGVSKVSGNLRRRAEGGVENRHDIPAPRASRCAPSRAPCRKPGGREVKALLTGGAGFIGQHVLARTAGPRP